MNNFQSDKPIYLQVVEEVKLKILCGELRPGDKLESVREMASRLAVNPNTIQRAFLELERQGFIVSQRAVGRFVSDNQEFIEKIKRQRIQETIQQFMDGEEFGADVYIDMINSNIPRTFTTELVCNINTKKYIYRTHKKSCKC